MDKWILIIICLSSAFLHWDIMASSKFFGGRLTPLLHFLIGIILLIAAIIIFLVVGK